jgi:hypothetical protein
MCLENSASVKFQVELREVFIVQFDLKKHTREKDCFSFTYVYVTIELTINAMHRAAKANESRASNGSIHDYV